MRGLGSPRDGRAAHRRVAAVRPHAATGSSWARAPGAHPRGPRVRQGPRRAHLRRGRGLRLRGRRLGHGPADRGRLGSARAMQAALERRGVPADEVDVINPHGTSTPLGDKREAEAIWTVFGDRAARDRKSLAISGTKSMTGHMMGAAGAFEAFATVMTHRRAVRPGDDQLPRLRPGGRPVGRPRDHADADPLRAVEQHRPRRPQRRDHLQALGRRLRGHATIRAGAAVRASAAHDPGARSDAAPSWNGMPCPPTDLARRAVITGLGAVMPIGNDFETYWRTCATA